MTFPEPSTFTLACIVAGALLIAMTLGGSFIKRLPLSAAMLYLLSLIHISEPTRPY